GAAARGRAQAAHPEGEAGGAGPRAQAAGRARAVRRRAKSTPATASTTAPIAAPISCARMSWLKIVSLISRTSQMVWIAPAPGVLYQVRNRGAVRVASASPTRAPISANTLTVFRAARFTKSLLAAVDAPR